MHTYLSDAVAFLHYMLDDLPKEANKVFEAAEKGDAIIFLPTIAAAELFHLFNKKKWKRMWSRFKVEMKNESKNFRYFPFDDSILELFEKTKADEIHDRIIISTAKFIKAEALLTKDQNLVETQEIKTIW